jgi:magnesium transporter
MELQTGTPIIKTHINEKIFFLTEITGTKVMFQEKKIGKIDDFVIIDKDKFAEVTHVCVARPFGDPMLIIPWEYFSNLTEKEITCNVDNLKVFENLHDDKFIFLKDFILDKKVLDVNGREVEVVYDVKLVMRDNKLYVVDVDLSRYGFLRRIGLKGIANFIYKLADKIQNQTVPWSYVEPMPEQIGSFKGDLKLKVIKEQIAEMPPVDLADILEEMPQDQRMVVFNQLDTEQASDTLEEIDPHVQRNVIASLQKEKTAVLINEMTPAQGADVLSILPLVQVEEILKLLEQEHANKIKSILKAQQVNISDFAIPTYIKFNQDKTAQQTRRSFQRMAKGKDAINYLYILDSNDALVGVVNLKELLIAEDESLLKDIMNTKVVSLNNESSLKDATEMFARYYYRALPVVEQSGKMLGVILYKDVMNMKHLHPKE